MGRKGTDITGRRYCRLVAVEDTEEGYGETRKWLCKCDCGKEKIVSRASMIRGMTKSCGCLIPGPNKVRDLSGKRFGMLVALEEVGKCTGNGRIWRCKCDCGNIKDIPRGHLTRKIHVKSCGCLNTGHRR